MRTGKTFSLLAALFIGSAAYAAARVDTAATETLMRRSACFTCHTADRKKDGPSFKEIAIRFKAKANADALILERIRRADKVRINGIEEDHDPIKSKDADELKAVVKWIRSH